MFRSKFAVAAAGAATLTAAGLAASPAFAATSAGRAAASPMACHAPSFYETSGGHHYFVVKKPTHDWTVSGAAGLDLTMQVSKGTQVGSTYTTSWGDSVGVNIKFISAAAHAEVSNAIQNTVTTGTNLSAHYTVRKFATIEFGAWGYSYNWEKGYIAGGPSKCVVHITAKGTATSPASAPGFNRIGS
ncbi:MAG: hypothetical protein JO016_09210 [Actinobacteria bacterium]|nr:hypothetical protein [Actinomycetota bacterium]